MPRPLRPLAPPNAVTRDLPDKPRGLPRPTDENFTAALANVPGLDTQLRPASQVCLALANAYNCSTNTTRHWLDHHLARPNSTYIQLFVANGTVSSILLPYANAVPARGSNDWYRRQLITETYPYLLDHHLPVLVDIDGHLVDNFTDHHRRPYKRDRLWIGRRDLFENYVVDRIQTHQKAKREVTDIRAAREAAFAEPVGRARALLHHLGAPARFAEVYTAHYPRLGTPAGLDSLHLHLPTAEAIHAFGELLARAGLPVLTEAEYNALQPGQPLDAAAHLTTPEDTP